jgi:type IV pilus assembly protein PilM
LFFSRFLAFDIGTYNTKIVQASIRGSKINVSKFAMFSTPQNTVDDGNILNVNVLAEQIKKHLKSNKMKEKKAVITISGTSIITREIVLPKANQRELQAMINIEAPQYFPVNMDNYILDYKVLEEIKVEDGVQYRIILVAVPFKVIDGYVQLMSKCNLHLNAIDFVGNSIVKLMKNEILERSINKNLKNKKNVSNNQNRQNNEIDTLLEQRITKVYQNESLSVNTALLEKQEIEHTQNEEVAESDTVAVIDIGCHNTTITILSKGVLKFNRILLYGSNDFSKNISSNLHLSLEQAEQKKISRGMIMLSEDIAQDSETIVISESIRAVLLNFIDDVSRLFDFYNSRETGNRIDRIYLIGGGALVKGIEEYIENALTIKTERIHRYKSIRFSNKTNFNDYIIYFSNCLGAVINK